MVTGEMVEELLLAGADIIKVGIGPGSVCTTRIKTGVGYPQLSAVIECADAAHGLGGHIISVSFFFLLFFRCHYWKLTALIRKWTITSFLLPKDGGCSCPGDVAKAFGAGADFVMLGGMFAGHEQCGGDIIERNGCKMQVFYGMSSSTAMQKHAGGVAEYRSVSKIGAVIQCTYAFSLCCQRCIKEVTNSNFELISELQRVALLKFLSEETSRIQFWTSWVEYVQHARTLERQNSRNFPKGPRSYGSPDNSTQCFKARTPKPTDFNFCLAASAHKFEMMLNK